MSRPASEAFLTGIAGDEIDLFYTVEMDLPGAPPDGILRLWSGVETKSFLEDESDSTSGKDYLGAGNIMAVSSIEETSETSAKGLTITLNGLSTEFLAVSLGESYKGRPVDIHLGVYNGATPHRDLVFRGEMDVMSINDGGESASLVIAAESHLVRLERASIARYTNEYQKTIYPSDRGFEYVNALQNAKISWGSDGNSSVDRDPIP